MRVRSLTFGLLGLGIALTVSSTALANYTYTETIGGQGFQTNWGPGTSGLPGANPFVIPQFTPGGVNAGSALKEVDVTMTYHFQNALTMTFVNSSTLTLSYQDRVNVTTPDGNSTNLSFSHDSGNISVSYPSANMVLTHGQWSRTDTFSASKSVTYTDASHLAMFTGSQTVSLPAVATGSSSFSTSSGNGSGSVSTMAWVTLTVTYVTPEPSSLVLAGLGAGGLYLATRGRSLRPRRLAA